MEDSREIKIEEVLKIVEDYIFGLKKLENELVDEINFYKEIKIELILNNDFRPGTFSRILSNVVSAKFMSYRILDYFRDKNWEDDFLENITPSPWKESKYYGHVEDILMNLRFSFFHSVYCQIETTHRIISRNIGGKKSVKPATAVNELTNTYNSQDLILFDFLRNTIHNNGIHIPLQKDNRNSLFNVKGKDFNFKYGEKINLSHYDIIEILFDQIEKMKKTLKHPKIQNIEFIEDLS